MILQQWMMMDIWIREQHVMANLWYLLQRRKKTNCFQKIKLIQNSWYHAAMPLAK